MIQTILSNKESVETSLTLIVMRLLGQLIVDKLFLDQ